MDLTSGWNHEGFFLKKGGALGGLEKMAIFNMNE